MKERMKRMVRWISTKGLVWLGFGATPFVFMACYGPVPTNYDTVRNIFEKAIGAQADRLAALEEVSKATDDQLSLITREDLEIGFATVEGVNLPKETAEATAAPAADEGVADVNLDDVIGTDHPEGTDASQN